MLGCREMRTSVLEHEICLGPLRVGVVSPPLISLQSRIFPSKASWEQSLSCAWKFKETWLAKTMLEAVQMM